VSRRTIICHCHGVEVPLKHWRKHCAFMRRLADAFLEGLKDPVFVAKWNEELRASSERMGVALAEARSKLGEMRAQLEAEQAELRAQLESVPPADP
jgi:hypothetical protein